MKKYISLFIIPLIMGACASLKTFKGDQKFKTDGYHEALLYYEDAYKIKPSDILALKIAECYKSKNDYKQSEQWFKIVDLTKGHPPKYLLMYADVLRLNKKHEKAKLWYHKYLMQKPQDTKAWTNLNACDMVDKFKADSFYYQLKQLDLKENGSDFSPILYKDGIVFSSSRLGKGKTDNWTGDNFLNLYYSAYIEPDSFSSPTPLNGVINSKLHDGPCSFTEKGDLIYFTRNKPKEEKTQNGIEETRNLEIYSSKLIEGEWGELEPFPLNEPNYSVGHPSVSPDGKIIYFVSDKPGGFGGTDIYYSVFEGGKWSPSINAGNKINSPGDELFPFINQREGGLHLYFSSNGWEGLGGLDIYHCIIKKKHIPERVHLQYPMNSSADDFGIALKKGEESGFLSTNRFSDDGTDEILSFRYIQQKHVLKIILIDRDSKSTIANQPIHIINKSYELVSSEITNEFGRIYKYVEPNQKFLISSRPKGYFVKRQSINIPDLKKSDTVLVIIELEKIAVNKKLIVENIYYDYDKWNLKKEAEKGLDQLVGFLMDNPTVTIELSSHTDSRGSDKYNLKLSQKRADAAVKYIVKKGINCERISAKGYGESQLLNVCDGNSNCSEEEHQVNRRTELTIISI